MAAPRDAGEERLLDEQPPSDAAPNAEDDEATSGSPEAEIEAATERPIDGSAPAMDGDAPDAPAESTHEPEAESQEQAGDEAAPDPLAEAQRERDEYLALARRTQADFENYRKRAAREAAAAGQRAKTGLVGELLPAIDNLERALSSAEDGDSGLAKGVALVHSELIGVLERGGVKAFEPAGERFDPTLHEALSTRSEDGTEPGVVLDVAQKGYRLGDSVIRPARVVVSA